MCTLQTRLLGYVCANLHSRCTTEDACQLPSICALKACWKLHTLHGYLRADSSSWFTTGHSCQLPSCCVYIRISLSSVWRAFESVGIQLTHADGDRPYLCCPDARPACSVELPPHALAAWGGCHRRLFVRRASIAKWSYDVLYTSVFNRPTCLLHACSTDQHDKI